MSIFQRFKAGLAKTAQQIRERLSDAAPASASAEPSARHAAVVETPEAVEDALIGADVGLAATERILSAVRNGRGLPAEPGSEASDRRRPETLRDRVAAEVRRILADVPQP